MIEKCKKEKRENEIGKRHTKAPPTSTPPANNLPFVDLPLPFTTCLAYILATGAFMAFMAKR